MRNERLRLATLRAGHDPESMAQLIGASQKSVRRWLDGSSTPHPKMRYRVAAELQEDESYLWPESADRASLAEAEIVSTWPRRSNVPKALWVDLLKACNRNFDLLAYAGLFLTEEHSDWISLLRYKARNGVRIRLLIGDPLGKNLLARDNESRIGGGVAGRVSAVMSHYAALCDVVEVRGHDTPLYNSIYRYDDEMLVNSHVYGILAAYTPTLRLRRIDGQFFDVYMESFERVWAQARALNDEMTQVE
ncbi:MAG: hypothetical protein ACRCYQ_12655 [Nocardioides sp.]